jgi:hypothetical protein
MRLLLLLLPLLSFADKNCPDRPFVLQGGAVKQVREFDRFILKPHRPEAFATRLAKEGLPFSLDVKRGGVNVSDWISAEGISGDQAYLFLKKLSVGEKSGLRFDQAFLLERVTDKRAKHHWNVPFNTFYPVALEGDELIFSHQLHPFCQDGDSREVMLAVKPDGSLRVRSEKLKPEGYRSVKPCPAKRFFPKSDYASCSELTDRRTKRKMVLVWEQPMS